MPMAIMSIMYRLLRPSSAQLLLKTPTLCSEGFERCLCTLSVARVNPHILENRQPSYNQLNPHQLQQVRCIFQFPKLPKLKDVANASNRKEYSERRILGYTMEQMYDIVSDVGSYKEFIPWCTDSSMRNRTETGCIGFMQVGFPPVMESYHSKIKLVRPTLVHSECAEGKLFSHLLTVWRFSPGIPGNPKTCTLDFMVQFDFRSKLHSKLATVFFDEVVRTMVKAFLSRAKQKYGPESIRPQKPKVIEYQS